MLSADGEKDRSNLLLARAVGSWLLSSRALQGLQLHRRYYRMQVRYGGSLSLV
jgi:hypothetical protein